MTEYQQLNMFGEEELGQGGAMVKTKRLKPKGGSQNPIVFHDYESYVEKFQNWVS